METRLQKFFTDCGVLSRRAAEAEIEAGHVKVNGHPAFIGQKIDPARDCVTWKGKRITLPDVPHKTYVMINKPRGYVTTTSDEHGRKCVTELLDGIDTRLYPVGRLDMDSDGLLLLTNDGELANFLTHPRHEIPKIYHVSVKGFPSEDKLRELGRPIEIDGVKTRPVKIKLIAVRENGTSTLEIPLYEGKNRQIRRMCEAAGLEIVKLTRIAIGDLKLGKLAPGKWQHLTRSQVLYFKGLMKKSKNK